MTPIVETRGLTKRYGPFQALEELNLSIESGVVVAVRGFAKNETLFARMSRV